MCAVILLWATSGLFPSNAASQAAAGALPPGASCLAPSVPIARYGDARHTHHVRLTHCDGRPNLDALRALSILARPRRVPQPSEDARSATPDFISRDIIRLDPGLLTRLQAIADNWPGETIVFVSGFRPRARSSSRHRHGQALDLQVTNVPLREVVIFARELPDTGVGYYPNSLFTHVDVRPRSAFWVDLSSPGQPARYVAANERESYLEANSEPSPEPRPSNVLASASSSSATRSGALEIALSQLEGLQRALSETTEAPARPRSPLSAERSALPVRRQTDDGEMTPAPEMPSDQAMARMLARAEALSEGRAP